MQGVATTTANRPGTPILAGQYDVVIVGGGSAGAVLARRLSEGPGRTVLLLEAGRAYGPWSYPPNVASSDRIGDSTGVDWGYKTEPGWIGCSIGTTRGKVLGGSSAINGAVAISVATNVTTIAIAEHLAGRLN